MVSIKFTAAVLFSSIFLVSAAPTSQADQFPNMVVLVRNSMEEGFTRSTAMTDQVKSEIRSGRRIMASTEVVTEAAEEQSIVPKSFDIDASREVLDILEKRSTISLSYCQNSSCTQGCLSTTSTFTANFCLNVPGTQCIIIFNLANAKIRYWNHTGCNGRESTFEGCGQSGNLGAPGTNSIGFQLNCN